MMSYSSLPLPPPYRHHRQWQQTYEGIMLLYLELCVDLKEHRGAKDGLHQYRNMSQQHVRLLSFLTLSWGGGGEGSGKRKKMV